MGEWVLCVIANWEYRGVVFSCKIGCLHTSTWRSTAYCRYLIAKRQRNFTGNFDVWSSKTALVYTCIGPCSVKKKIYTGIIYIESGVTRITLRDFTSHPHTVSRDLPYYNNNIHGGHSTRAYCSINRDVTDLLRGNYTSNYRAQKWYFKILHVNCWKSHFQPIWIHVYPEYGTGI